MLLSNDAFILFYVYSLQSHNHPQHLSSFFLDGAERARLQRRASLSVGSLPRVGVPRWAAQRRTRW